MGLPVHIIDLIEGSSPLNGDRLVLGVKNQVANVIGGGADAIVTTTVTFGTGKLPATTAYGVHITPDQNCTHWVTNRTTAGFDVVLKPPAGGTLAVGKFDVLVLA